MTMGRLLYTEDSWTHTCFAFFLSRCSDKFSRRVYRDILGSFPQSRLNSLSVRALKEFTSWWYQSKAASLKPT